jgi:hypothetical protein
MADHLAFSRLASDSHSIDHSCSRHILGCENESSIYLPGGDGVTSRIEVEGMHIQLALLRIVQDKASSNPYPIRIHHPLIFGPQLFQFPPVLAEKRTHV